MEHHGTESPIELRLNSIDAGVERNLDKKMKIKHLPKGLPHCHDGLVKEFSAPVSYFPSSV